MDHARPGDGIFRRCRTRGDAGRYLHRRYRTRAQRFRDAALPHLDDAYTLARYLLRNAADAEDAVQECYLRALKHFDSYRGPAMKPWLFAILRNVCRAEYARRAGSPTGRRRRFARASRADAAMARGAGNAGDADAAPARGGDDRRNWSPRWPSHIRETLVLREIHNLSYREIADIVEVPVGTVMSRLARARAMLRAAWMAEEEQPK